MTTPLEPFGEDGFTFWAANYDLLVDSPFEVGTHPVYAFEVDGKPHELAVWGKGNFEPQRAIADMQRIIATEASLFGGLPYDRYVFILHLTHKGYGGLEHLNSCSLIFHRFGFQQAEQYRRFLCLVAMSFSTSGMSSASAPKPSRSLTTTVRITPPAFGLRRE